MARATSDSRSTPTPGALARLLALQLAFPKRFLGALLLLACACALLASRLELKLRFEQLLPESRASVVELSRIRANVKAGSHAFVVVEGGSAAEQRAFGDRLVARLRSERPAWLSDVSDGVQEARRFLAPRAGLFAGLEQLKQLQQDVDARWSWEVANAEGANIDDAPPPELSWQSVKQRFGLSSAQKFPSGYYQDEKRGALVVVVDTSIETGELDQLQSAFDLLRVRAEAARQATPGELRLSYAGDLVTGLAEYGAATRDLLSVGSLGVGLVLLVLLFYFRTLRALLTLGAALALGLAVTFGATELAIGHLNVATGFLVSIVAGNGINFGIIYLARYYEERRRGRAVEPALGIAHAQTWPGTLAAAAAAAAAYGSLGISDFGAFRDFALIGSIGMLVCWCAAYLLLPPLLLLLDGPSAASLLERFRARVLAAGPRPRRAVSALVSRWPRALGVGGVALGLAGALSLLPYVKSDPLEYDMRRMQNDLGASSSSMYRAAHLSADILGAKLDGAMLILADSPEQVPELKRQLERRRDSAPPGEAPFQAVHTVFDAVPEQQAEKLPILAHLASRLRKAHARGFVSERDYAQLEPYLPPPDLEPWTVADLPAAITRPFTDRAGVVGRLALIEPTAGQSDSDVKYLMRWADSFRSVPLPSGATIHGSGRAVIFADILSTVLHDIPRSVTLAFCMTVGAILLTFRRGARALLVVGSLLIGLGWVVLGMALLQLKINFFNFVALPVSFGIGADYAVNLMQRYSSEPERGVLAALESTGGAVTLCSLTTILGYLALLLSVNQAIRSLGLLAVLGEVGCLLAATLVLPALLLWRERRAQGRARASSPGAEQSSPLANPSV